MKRALALTLLLTIMMGCFATEAFAKQIQTYGDGSKKTITLENKKGYKYTYYDIYDGAKNRQDASDPDMFFRKVISAKCRNTGISVGEAWDGLNIILLGSSTDLRLRGKTPYEMYRNMRLDFEHIGSNDPTLCNSIVQAENGIRKDYEKLMRSKVDKQFGDIHVNKALQALNYTGPTYYTMNAVATPYSCTMGWGSIFYDIQLRYIEDGKLADSAVGAETDPAKAKQNAKRGFTWNQSAFRPQDSMKVINEDKKQTMTTTQSMSTSKSVSLENSVSMTQETSGSTSIGVSATVSGKIPLIADASLTTSVELTSGWLSSTTRGQSKRVEETTTVSRSATVKVPPRSVATLEISSAQTAANIEYDYPVAISYKVVNYIILDHDDSTIMAHWGGTNPDHLFATDNLRERYEHRANKGYESQFSNGWDVNWDRIKWEDNYYFITPSNYIPMSITGGTISGSGTAVDLRLKDVKPINAANLVEATGPSALTVRAGDTLDLAAARRVRAYTQWEDESKTDFYGFDEQTDGQWVICDKDGRPITSDLATMDANSALLKAGKANGLLYVKYQPDAREMDYYEGDMLCYSNVGAMTNNTLTKINIVGEPEQFAGTVSVDGELTAELRTPFDLREVNVALSTLSGEPVTEQSFPCEWQVAEGTSADISIKGGILTANKPGRYALQVEYGGQLSKPIPLVVANGVAAEGVALNQRSLTLNKNESAKLSATVSPLNAANTDVVWKSSDESIVTVDQNGKATGVGTGFAAIMATTKDGGYIDSCNVEVQVPLSSEGLKAGKIAMAKGAVRKLKNPGNAKGTWSIADKSIATLSGGRLRAKKLGETQLTFRVADAKGAELYMGKALQSGDAVTIPLVVRKTAALVRSLTVSPKTQYLAPGEKMAIDMAVKPANATDKEVFFTTNDKTVALVNDQGVVTAVDSGAATITVATCTGISKKVQVKVTKDVVGVAVSASKLTVGNGKTAHITASAKPASIAIQPYFVSSDEQIATVDQDGYVTGLKKGTCKIYVYKSQGSAMRAVVNVTVK